jgi:hypothetical protein
MALNSTLGSPGIEIREIDNSVRIDTNTSTTVFVPGFASQGPVEEVLSIGSIQDFELIYGKPTNGAERYFYYTVKALLDKGGSGIRVLTSRLPYGAGAGDYVSDGGDYIKLLDWLEETKPLFWLDTIRFHIHSMNPVGAENMRAIIKRNGWKEV